MSADAAIRRQAETEAERRQAGLERALTRAFWLAVQQQPLPIMAALEAAARVVGTLYREAAVAHGPEAQASGTCTCGWRPDPESDLIVLEAMLAASARAALRRDLATMPVAGRA